MMPARQRFLHLFARLGIVACSAFPALPAAAADSPEGTYAASGVSLAFDGHGHFHASINNTTMVEGIYTVNGDQLKVTDHGGPWACIKGPEERTGTYRWKVEANTLTLTNIADNCADRVKTLTPSPWKKQN